MTKNLGGRPTKLTPAIVKEAEAYLADTTNMSAIALLPTIEGLALRLHIHRDTLYEWEKEDKRFSDILEELRQSQAEKLLQNSLANRYNSTIAKMILSGKHGYIEKQAVENSGEQKVIVEITKYAAD